MTDLDDQPKLKPALVVDNEGGRTHLHKLNPPSNPPPNPT
jgi:hypothetical protein